MSLEFEDAKQIRKAMKIKWNELLQNKYVDKKMDETISKERYYLLQVDEGEVISSSKDGCSIDFNTILEKQLGPEMTQRIDIDPRDGGWNQFYKTKIKNKVSEPKKYEQTDYTQNQRKHGKGWLNKIRYSK